MPRPIVFGEISGIEEGHTFENRKEMMPSSFHRNWVAGIDGNGKEGAAAIVMSGGYEDDIDNGNEIIYTGAGGNDPKTGRQIADQSWDHPGNAGLLLSMDKGLPVRVVRGHQHDSEFTPVSGYEYGGLYSVVDAWKEMGKSGYRICRFRLIYNGLSKNGSTPDEPEFDGTKGKKGRSETTILRIIRDTKLARDIKELYKFECQVCGTAIKTKNGFYAEGAHIRPLGKPHNGDDSSDNLLCLCPNHHVMFDKGSFSISGDLNLLGNEHGKLILASNHKINQENLKYHREINGFF